MNFYADQVGTAMIDVGQLPWIPFLPYSDQCAAHGLTPVDITAFHGN